MVNFPIPIAVLIMEIYLGMHFATTISGRMLKHILFWRNARRLGVIFDIKCPMIRKFLSRVDKLDL